MEQNTGLLTSKGNFDSGLMNQHVDIVRLVTEAGKFKCTIIKNQSIVYTLRVNVIDNHAEQVTYMDLYSLTNSDGDIPDKAVATNGYLVFHSSWETDQYTVKLETKDMLIMDSRALSDSEQIVITPFVPGIYTIEDLTSKAKGTIEVKKLEGATRSERSQTRAQLLAHTPPNISIANGKFDPSSVVVQGDQPVIITAAEETRIVGSL